MSGVIKLNHIYEHTHPRSNERIRMEENKYFPITVTSLYCLNVGYVSDWKTNINNNKYLK